MVEPRSWPSQLSNIVLALNAGSSSLKFGLFEQVKRTAELQQIALGVARPGAVDSYQVKIVDRNRKQVVDEAWQGDTVDDLLPGILNWMDRTFDLGTPVAVGHRIVHGGQEFFEPTIIDDRTLSRLEALIPLAPLHQPACLRPVQLISRLRPDLRQFACFDTAFHQTIQPPASRYALPRKLEDQGIHRYGYHGLSFGSIAAQLRREDDAVAKERVVIAHLGNGSSLCALRNLQSVDTTMGFSTLDGLVMGTRPGSLDPGVVLYLLSRGWSADQLEQLLYRESGLLGVSGISSDVGVLLASDAPSAMQALELFAFQVARHAGALAATMGGLDRFVFTGGIGENAAEMRHMIVDRLALFDAKLNAEANAAGERVISCADSAILIERRETKEELAIARQVCAII